MEDFYTPMGEDSVVSDAETLEDLLVVEDNPGDVRLIQEAFEDSALETTVHTVSTGEEALDFVNRRGEYEVVPRPDVILLDWSLPTMDGEAVLRELKTNFPGIPVVIMTGSNPLREAVESMTSLADAYLTKPTNPDAYTEILCSLATVGTESGT